jgi:molybdopterin synthase catalytic subunit
MIEVKISKKELNIAKCIMSVISDEAGGIDVFIGTVRNKTKGKNVKYLFYETYEKMALLEMEKIAKYATKKWKLKKVVIHHRKGKLEIGETAVVIAVSAPHRKEAFEACRYIIDTLKATVPIWKKEVFEDGEKWVSPNP